MIECPVYLINPDELVGSQSEPPTEPTDCNQCCKCGYIQFEQLIPYLDEIKRLIKWDREESDELEMQLREQILEISRLFDIQAGVNPGYFSPVHYETTKIFPTNGTRYIKLPEFVLGTLEVRTSDNYLLDDSSYGYKDGFLIYLPCVTHKTCGCHSGCGETKSLDPVEWPNTCYKITARWGKQCADYAVQMAVRDYLIETYRVQDPVIVQATGLPTSRTFRVPHSWSTYINNFKAKRDLYSKFAIA